MVRCNLSLQILNLIIPLMLLFQKKWQYKAKHLRDDYEDGITVEEYKRWMEGYFPNRKRAEDSGTEK